MHHLFISLLLILQINTNKCKDLPTIRNLFKNGIDENELAEINKIYENSDCEKITPYYAVATMKNAEFTWSPIKKMSYFKKGKEILETFITRSPKNLEARYLRWITQSKAPRFLGYYNELEIDYKFIQENINKSGIDKDYQKFMLNNIETIKNE